MRRSLLAAVVAGAIALTTSLMAQDPKTPPPSPSTPATQAQSSTVTVEGCVMREADVPGRKPNVAERAGIAEDYILTSTKMIKGSAPTGKAGAGDKPTGTAGAGGAMYEIRGIDDTQLKQHVGRRVQIEGTFANVDRAKAPPECAKPGDDTAAPTPGHLPLCVEVAYGPGEG
jgi:hypothetical protein